MKGTFDRDGWAWLPGTLDGWGAIDADRPIRDALGQPGELRALAVHPALVEAASALLGAPAFAVRATLFAKSGARGWWVPWHQDRVVTVRAKAEVEGFTAWSTKGGRPHAMAPQGVLQEMVALRVHLDPCPAEAGPLQVLPGTHDRVWSEAEREAIDPSDAVTLTAKQGQVLAMRPLLVHRSAAFEQPGLRRVLHVEWAAAPLPPPLEWRYPTKA